MNHLAVGALAWIMPVQQVSLGGEHMLRPQEQQVRKRVRCIRLPDGDIEALLDELDRRESGRPRHLPPPRYSYRVPDMHLDLAVSNAGPMAPYSVPTRWLSDEAVGCLYGSFVHRGNPCRVVLMTPYGTWHEQQGAVGACIHVGGHVHELEIHFTQPIDLSYFCLAAGSCRVLLVEDDKLVARMISAWFKQYNAEVDHVDRGGDVLLRCEQTRYDVILLDMELPDQPGWEVARRLRAAGYGGRILAISAGDTPQVQRRAFDAGCDQFLAKPFDRGAVAELVRSLREEPILSHLHDDPTMAEFLTAFVAGLPGHCRRLRLALKDGDFERLQRELRMLKSQSGTCGYDVLADAAHEIEQALNRGAPGADVMREMNELLRLCSRVRAPTVGRPGARRENSPGPDGSDDGRYAS